jgi:hypothetical protein
MMINGVRYTSTSSPVVCPECRLGADARQLGGASVWSSAPRGHHLLLRTEVPALRGSEGSGDRPKLPASPSSGSKLVRSGVFVRVVSGGGRPVARPVGTEDRARVEQLRCVVYHDGAARRSSSVAGPSTVAEMSRRHRAWAYRGGMYCYPALGPAGGRNHTAAVAGRRV